MLGKDISQTDGSAVGIMHLGIAHVLFEILYGSHLRVGWLISLNLLTDTCQQLIPLLHKGMGLHHHHKTDMISHSLTTALKHMRQVHEGIRHLARSIHHPCLFGLTQETLQTFADDRASDIKHEIGQVSLIVAHQTDRLVEQGIHGLTTDQHGALGLQEHPCDMTQCRWRHISSCPFDFPLYRQFTDSIVE